jgi:hypothetical protein
MSELYNELKYNVDKINTLYKNGVTFHKNKTWIAPINGAVTLIGQANAKHALDYAINFSSTCSSSPTWGDNPARQPNLVANLCSYFGSKAAFVNTQETTITKGNEHKISFDENGIQFQDIYLTSVDSPIYSIKITNLPNQLGFYDMSVGSVLHIESEDKTNPSLLGDCDIQVTKSTVNHTTDPYTHMPFASLEISYKIINILRQPSQISEIPQYLKIQYNEDVLSIFNDNYS